MDLLNSLKSRIRFAILANPFAKTMVVLSARAF